MLQISIYSEPRRGQFGCCGSRVENLRAASSSNSVNIYSLKLGKLPNYLTLVNLSLDASDRPKHYVCNIYDNKLYPHWERTSVSQFEEQTNKIMIKKLHINNIIDTQ